MFAEVFSAEKTPAEQISAEQKSAEKKKSRKEKRESQASAKTLSRIQSTGLNGLILRLIQVGPLIKNLIGLLIQKK